MLSKFQAERLALKVRNLIMCTETYFTEFILLIPMKHSQLSPPKSEFHFQKYMHFLNLIKFK